MPQSKGWQMKPQILLYAAYRGLVGKAQEMERITMENMGKMRHRDKGLVRFTDWEAFFNFMKLMSLEKAWRRVRFWILWWVMVHQCMFLFILWCSIMLENTCTPWLSPPSIKKKKKNEGTLVLYLELCITNCPQSLLRKGSHNFTFFFSPVCF